MDNIEIRELLPEDAEQMIEYLKKIGGETDNLTFGKEGLPITVEQEKEFLRQARESKQSVHYGAWKNGQIIGHGNLSGFPRRMSHRAEMSLAVMKSEWNQGIGSMLVEKLIHYARQNEIEIIQLEVRSDNTGAIHLYEKHGFQRIGTIPAYFKMENAYFDFDMMCLDLR
ncbi:MAG: GNAT family N-acetyltransferase [Lachnospiraceae bacterium]|jgi:ribosomal protein S18 acetylase RimI-like enzyme|nr:GNAT family N-acetyltransferase [Lachnospiraceae bacterium]